MIPLNCKPKIKIILIILVTVFILLTAICGIYLSDYYRADMEAIEAFAPTAPIQTDNHGNLVFGPEDAATGFIFYPGGKVEHTAYIPLMQALAANDILCVLVEMPFRLAVFDINAANGIQEQHPQIENWYLGGHSLGGSMAAAYLAEESDAYDGLILLGSYSTADLSETDLTVLSIFGSEDRVMNRENYDANLKHLPEDSYEIVIDGGCHAFFGMYGPQDGDGIPTITNEEQINLTVAAILDKF